MFSYTSAQVDSFTVHYIGNPDLGGRLILNPDAYFPDEGNAERLKTHFLPRFTSCIESWKFHHHTDLQYHAVYQEAVRLFTDPSQLKEAAQAIAKQLYEKSRHPRIKQGEFFVCYIRHVEFDGQRCDAVGLFKTESRRSLLAVEFDEDDKAYLEWREGLELNAFDKGCLILNQDKAEGCRVLMLDKQGKEEEARYWRDDFLGLEPLSDEHRQTTHFLKNTRDYLKQRVVEEFDFSKPEQIGLLQRSVDYFRSHESFAREEFEQDVLQQPDLIASFRKHTDEYAQLTGEEIPESFAISQPAVKRQSKVFKSVIKLDKNFHIYVHGNRDLIERGVDELGRKYYILYYDEEKLDS